MAKIGAPKKSPQEIKRVMTIRVRAALKTALKKGAADDCRPVATLVEKILTDWAKAKGYLK
jgi:hypothetical protein